jgi:hypothetical protein
VQLVLAQQVPITEAARRLSMSGKPLKPGGDEPGEASSPRGGSTDEP